MKWSSVEKWSRPNYEITYTLPQDWKYTPLRNLLKQVANPITLKDEELYTFVGVKWYGEGIFERESLLGSEVAASKAYRVSPNALIYNRLFAWKESFALTPEDPKGLFVSNEFPQFEIDLENCFPEFVLLACLSRRFILMVNRLSSGSAAVSRNRLKESEFLDLSIPLPPLSVQRKIVERWRAAVAQAEVLEANATQTQGLAQTEFLAGLGLQAPQTQVKKRAFVTRWSETGRWGTEVNQGSDNYSLMSSNYPSITLRHVIKDLENGWSPQCEARPAKAGEWGVLKVGAASFGEYAEDQNKALPARLAPIARYEVKAGDLLISRANVTRLVGASVLVRQTRDKLMLCDKLFRVVWPENPLVVPEFLNNVLRIPQVRDQIENSLTGTSPTMKNISKPSLLALEFPLPPLSVQQSLVDAVDVKRQAAAKMRIQADAIRKQARAALEEAILGRDPSILEEV